MSVDKNQDSLANGPVTLCTPFNPCPPCCPELNFSEGKFQLSDDYDSEIELTVSEIKQVINDLDKIISVPGDSVDN